MRRRNRNPPNHAAASEHRDLPLLALNTLCASASLLLWSRQLLENVRSRRHLHAEFRLQSSLQSITPGPPQKHTIPSASSTRELPMSIRARPSVKFGPTPIANPITHCASAFSSVTRSTSRQTNYYR